MKIKFKPLILISGLIIFSMIGFIPTSKYSSAQTLLTSKANVCVGVGICHTISVTLTVSSGNTIIVGSDTSNIPSSGCASAIPTDSLNTTIIGTGACDGVNLGAGAGVWALISAGIAIHSGSDVITVTQIDGSVTILGIYVWIVSGSSDNASAFSFQVGTSATSAVPSMVTDSGITVALVLGNANSGSGYQYTPTYTGLYYNNGTADTTSESFIDQAPTPSTLPIINNAGSRNYVEISATFPSMQISTTITSTITAWNSPSLTNYNWIIFAIMVTMFTGIGWFIVGYVNVGDRKPIIFISMFTLFLGALFGVVAGYGNSTGSAFIPLGVVFIYGSGFVLYLIRGVRR